MDGIEIFEKKSKTKNNQICEVFALHIVEKTLLYKVTKSKIRYSRLAF